jgi:hypothetical protein
MAPMPPEKANREKGAGEGLLIVPAGGAAEEPPNENEGLIEEV